MRIKSILISIVIAATAGMWCACNDDLDLGVNDAKLEKVEGFRISKFTTDRLNWAIDNGADIRIVFHSNADDALYEFSMTVDNSGTEANLSTPSTSRKSRQSPTANMTHLPSSATAKPSVRA